MDWAEYDKPRVSRRKRPPRKRILVVTEGAVTEKFYFERLKTFLELKKYQLEVIVECGPDHDGNTPSRVVSSAVKLRDKAVEKQRIQDKRGNLEAREKFDEVWVVFDTERDGRNNDLKPAAEHAERSNLKVAISKPSIESWFLLHLRDGLPTAMATCAHVCDEISKITRKLHARQYRKKCKNNSDLLWLVELILPKTDEAARRSSHIAKMAFTTHRLVPSQPGTKVHELIQSLSKASPSGGRDKTAS